MPDPEASDPLSVARENAARLEVAEREHRNALRLLNEHRNTLAEHRAVLEREAKDVQQLEGLTLARLFHEVLRSKDDRLAKEQAEHLTARLKYEDAEQVVQQLELDLKAIDERIGTLFDARRSLEAAIHTRRQELKTSDSPEGRHLAEMDEQSKSVQAKLQPLEQAMRFGRAAATQLERAISCLDSAVGWGAVDLLGGGTLVTLGKHSAFDSARNHVSVAQLNLKQFQTELADLTGIVGNALGIGPAFAVADLFYDGLIADWFVQSKIVHSRSAVQGMLIRVQTSLAECTRMRNQLHSDSKRLEQQKRDVIAKA